MKKAKISQDRGLVLKFRTIPSANTIPTSLEIDEGTNWHIYGEKDGIYIARFIPRDRYLDARQISTYPDPTIAKSKHFVINSKINAFKIPFNANAQVVYSVKGGPYIPLVAKEVMETDEHKFRCGSIEFSLQLEKRKIMSQLELF